MGSDKKHQQPDSFSIRDVEDGDMAPIQQIYADQVLTGVSSWEEEPPTLAEMCRRREAIVSGGFPYRVAVKADPGEPAGERVLGYAYASSYRPRPGYRYTVENSIYVNKMARGQGIGRLLLQDLIKQCEARGYRQMIAVVGDSANRPSIDFHLSMGFAQAGVIKSIGFKFGRWMDSVILQRPLNNGDASLPE
ncbi:GNAT family N-acetyltransferase [Kiloniella laminariae]|uniref:GNAT family N-acetyltransferase n=1 Tax=Kiloniella laminariae TaxID=454162 RepID=A0ABT4LEF6_9PROT|nr:GNAT family N-acetyltransferase [Kiloniella laminariae]MCZ4279474.1 GNAT family N-acetyltransferase [Kiloniella laminariae]